jgi:hypothetical protein
MSKIEVRYNGSYPNLCSGDLVVIIDKEEWKFPSYCLSSGGSVSFDNDWSEEISNGEWSISDWPKDFPDDLKQETVEAINDSIDWGCCGGCI